MGREILQSRKDFLGLFFADNFRADVELGEVVLIGAEQASEDRARRGGGAGVKAVANGGVETGEGVLLGFFEHGKEATEAIPGIGVSFVEHGGDG